MKSPGQVSRLNALTGHVIAVDGQLVGGWRRTLNRKGVVVDLGFTTRLTAAEQSAVEKAARTYGDFLGLAAEVRTSSA